MAGSSEETWRRPTSRFHADLHDDEPEEGEIVPGYHSDMDTEEYYNRHSYSDETVSDSNVGCSVPANCDEATSTYPVAANNNNGGNPNSSSVAAPVMLPCPVCGKEFRSQNAVCGHMKVHRHGLGRPEQGIVKAKGIKRDVAFVGRCGGTGKRGYLGLGGRAATPNAESDQSMAIVVAEPQIVSQPMPSAFAAPNPSSVSITSASPDPPPVPEASATTNVSEQSSSAQPMNDDDMDTVVVAGAANPRSEAVVNLHPAPPSTPPAAGELAPSIPQQPIAPQLPPAVVERPPPVHQPPIAPRPAAGRQNPNGYTCNECGAWFRTHQGLGGHRAAHNYKNRDLAAAAAGMLGDGAAAPSCRNAKPEKTHVCNVCGAVFSAGVQLGGHKRKHYAGPPIVPNKKPRLAVQPLLPPPPARTIALLPNAYADEASPAPAAVAAPQPGPAPEVERAPEPAPGPPAMARRVLLFGVDIGVGMKRPAAQEGPSETEGSASTGGEQ